MKNIVLLLLILIQCNITNAQGVDFGVKAGVNFSTLSDASDLKNQTGFVGGIFAGINFNDKSGIRIDALYSKQGAKLTEGDFDLNYLNIPVVYKHRLVSKLHFQIGPQFGFVLDEKIKITQPGGVIDDLDTKKFDLSGVVGLGLDIPLGFRLEARYVFGLSDINDNMNYSGKNRVFSILVGYSIL
ncbi:MAG: PorT family protein [Psychroserpens sp.]|nr:PorT family protein [Psychroserpens sp.]